MKQCDTVVEYMERLPAEVRPMFDAAWRAILALVPEGEEAIRYGMPTIRWKGRNLVHLAAMKHHIGFYPTPSGVLAFLGEVQGKYEHTKGAIRFPLGAKLPLPLIRKIVKFRLAEERKRRG